MILQCSKKHSLTTTVFLFKVLKSLSHHGLKYLDISECSNVTSKQLATLLTQQPNIEQLSLQGTCEMSAILQVFEASSRFLTRLRCVINSSQCNLEIKTTELETSNSYALTIPVFQCIMSVMLSAFFLSFYQKGLKNNDIGLNLKTDQVNLIFLKQAVSF